jgi:hypothetical protein
VRRTTALSAKAVHRLAVVLRRFVVELSASPDVDSDERRSAAMLAAADLERHVDELTDVPQAGEEDLVERVEEIIAELRRAAARLDEHLAGSRDPRDPAPADE